MYGKVHHIGIGVRDLEKTIHICRDVLGIPLEKKIDWSNLGLKAALFPIGDTWLEFIEPVKPTGEIPQSLAEAVQFKDGVVHHLCLSVENIEEAIQSLKGKGVKMLNQEPLKTEGGKIAWLKKDVIDGFMIELCEKDYEIK